MNRRGFLKSIYGFPTALSAVAGLPGSHLALLAETLQTATHHLDHAAPCATEFLLDNVLDHPLYYWPRTLLNYRIACDHPIDLKRYQLRCTETNESIPFQLAPAGPANSTALLRFFSDLPVSAKRTYRLIPGSPAASSPAITSTTAGDTITLNSGPMQIRIPATQQVTGAAPGPIQQVCRGGKWVGSSTLSFPTHRILSITAEPIELGPLFHAYKLTYAIEGGGKYTATIEVMAGTDFVRLYEEMHVIPPEGGGVFNFTWTGCEYTHRQMPNHPYPFPIHMPPQHTYEDYPWEPITQKQANTHLGVIAGTSSTGEMTSELGVFQPWPAFIVGNFATFWSNPTSDAASIFIDRAELWIDPDYPIWSPSKRLTVKFFYADNQLSWHYPLEVGSRSTCLSFYDHAKDKEAMATMERAAVPRPDGEPYGDPSCYGLFLQNRYGTISLDRVKDWQLTYAGAQPPVIFNTRQTRSLDAFEHNVLHSDIVEQLMLTGTRQNGGFGPVPHRKIMDSWVGDYNQYNASMSEPQRRRITAHLLIQAYVCAGEDYMPMIPMLSGHPNFLSDVKSVPVGMAFLFPDHPQAKIWAAEWDRFLIMNTRYHTRPQVNTWDARGGRWTENLGTYVWGFVRPSLRADFLERQRDHQEHFTTPQIVQLGDWLVNALSAPFNGETPEVYATLNLRDAHLWGVVAPGTGPRRLHPPMGAHAERRKTPRAMWYIGRALQQYAPLTAEHLMWASRPTDQDQEQVPGTPDVWKIMYAEPDNLGTNPHLRTAKYTGFGITMRAAVDTPEELSVHLLQVDDGPNYRWGVPGEGGCGLVYYFAAGKGWSHNGKEDEGDRFVQDTDLGSNFGVWKGGKYVSIGQNVLSQPLYDLDYAQQAELIPRTGPTSYCTPEYVHRRVLLAGADYFVLYDHLFNESVGHRFSWFVHQGDDFPSITQVRGFDRRDADAYTALETKTTKGRWYDGKGDSMAVITHKPNITVQRTPYGASVHTPDSQDMVFMNPNGLRYEAAGILFDGASAIIRQRGQAFEIAQFHGKTISAAGLTFTTPNPDLGFSARIASNKNFTGKIYAPTPATIEITGLNPAGAMYLNGEKLGTPIQLPAGHHTWEHTDTQPKPLAPVILRTEIRSGAARLYATPCAAATQYRAELSDDNGATFKPVITSPTPTVDLTGLTNGKKYHARLIALNDHQQSDPGPEYPLYITREMPDPPAGLVSRLHMGRVTLTWGEALGVTEYRLYKRQQGQQAFTQIYHGLDRTYEDHEPSIRPANPIPDSVPDLKAPAAAIWEYAVTSANPNGEGPRSRICDTDPASWRNWDPRPDEPFRRANVASKFGTPPNDGFGFYYPA
jgi:hypothetical protein